MDAHAFSEDCRISKSANTSLLQKECSTFLQNCALVYCILELKSYLHKFKMDDFGQSITEHCVRSILR